MRRLADQRPGRARDPRGESRAVPGGLDAHRRAREIGRRHARVEERAERIDLELVVEARRILGREEHLEHVLLPQGRVALGQASRRRRRRGRRSGRRASAPRRPTRTAVASRGGSPVRASVRWKGARATSRSVAARRGTDSSGRQIGHARRILTDSAHLRFHARNRLKPMKTSFGRPKFGNGLDVAVHRGLALVAGVEGEAVPQQRLLHADAPPHAPRVHLGEARE